MTARLAGEEASEGGWELTLKLSRFTPPGSDPPFQYEALWSSAPDEWLNDIKCPVSGSPSPTATVDGDPPPGQVFHYVSRAFNACGVGPIGNRSDGTPRAAGPCP